MTSHLRLARPLLFLLIVTPQLFAATVLLSEADNSRILLYNVVGDTWSFAGVFAQGSYDGQALTMPMGMCTDAAGNVCVGEQIDGGRVLRFTPDGDFLQTIITDGDGVFNARCEAVVRGPDDSLYVVDAFANTDQVYRIDPNTSQVSIFIPQSHPGQYALNNPRGIAFGSNGKCYVTSRNNDSLFEFDADTGEFLRTIDSGSIIDYPQDCLWHDNHLLVLSSSGTAAIDRFHANGSYDQRILNAGVLPDGGISLGVVNDTLYVVCWSSNAVYRIDSPNAATLVTPSAGEGYPSSPNRMLVLDDIVTLAPASNPVPAHQRAYLDPEQVTLQWDAPPTTPAPIDHYEVFFGQDQAAVAATATPDITIPAANPRAVPLTSLDCNQTWFWRVDTVLTNATTIPGLLWQFTTEYIDIPGTVIDYSPNAATIYVGSPSIARLPDGSYVVSHDWFGAGTTFNQTAVLASSDQGHTWRHLSTVNGAFWSNLFRHNDALYLMGANAQYGRCVIRRSTDGGQTWTSPTSAATGLLFADSEYHTAPMPVVVQDGRLWRTMEDAQDPGGWGDHFRAFMMSAPVDADLLNAANWTSTNRLSHDATNWTGTGWLEGNAVVTPTGNIVDILRVAGVEEIAAIVNISSDGATASFDPANDFIPFHGGAAKFTIRHDPTSNRYWSLVNKQDDPDAFRNHLVLVSSADLRNWIVEDTVLFHPDTVNHAWQYIDWLFEGDDIVFVSRTAYDDGLGGSAHNAHDANFMTFHRIVNFRGPRAPVFDLHPRDQRVALGAPAHFSVAAHDAITAFQWFKLVPDGPDLPLADDTQYNIVSTADSSTLTILDVASHDLGQYYCTATNVTATATSNPAVLALYSRELLAHWKLDETLNGPVLESTANYPDGEIWSYVDGMLAHPGPDGPTDLAYDFAADTTVGGVATNAPGVIPAEGDFSLRVRFRTDNYHSAQGHLFSNNNSQTGRANLLLQDGLLRWWANLGVSITAADRVDDDQWHTAIVVRDGDDWRMYLDRRLAGSQTVAGAIDQSTMWMIGRSRNTQFNYEGLISGVRVYNYPVDASPDLNNDGHVNLRDWAIFVCRWLHTNCGACLGADQNLDLRVDLQDLETVLSFWSS